jgi:hypothetical protein
MSQMAGDPLSFGDMMAELNKDFVIVKVVLLIRLILEEKVSSVCTWHLAP